MKKILSIIIMLLSLTGCSINNNDIITKLKNKIEKLDSYKIEGVLEITNNETTYKYDIEVGYQKNEKYKVSLKNKVNDHKQIILKNNENVYVLTPSLNKSFKFQSEWPYNNSQSYLYQTILNDIENDDKVSVEMKDDGYIITSKVNYQNNKDLVNQKIYLDKNANVKRVEVKDKNGITKIKMSYNKFNDNPKFDKNYFELSGNIKIDEQKDKKTINEIDIAYPLYIPNETKLVSENVVESENGNRTILTFGGSKPFTLIEEVTKDDDNVVSVDGDIEFINGVLGNITDESVSWTSDGVDYYAVSNTMDTTELLEVVNSINVIPVGK